jgi:TPR repeat protein
VFALTPFGPYHAAVRPTRKVPRPTHITSRRQVRLPYAAVGRGAFAFFVLFTLLVGPASAAPQGVVPSPLADSLRVAAAGGDASAQYQYGALFVFGREGVGQSYESALEWFGRAAEQNHTAAMLAMSTVLFSSDPASAYRWLLRAGELGAAEAQWRLSQVLSGRAPLSGIATDRDAADAWLQQAIAQGHTIATVWLADLRTESDDPGGYIEAAELYRRAAESGGDGWSALRMGMMYALGEGVLADDVAAVDWFSRLATDYELDATEFSNPDLEVLGGLQWYYGVDFTGGELERDLEAAAEAFRIALEFPALLTHPSFERAAEAMLARIGN